MLKSGRQVDPQWGLALSSAHLIGFVSAVQVAPPFALMWRFDAILV